MHNRARISAIRGEGILLPASLTIRADMAAFERILLSSIFLDHLSLIPAQ
jgi:hypothetical protein